MEGIFYLYGWLKSAICNFWLQIPSRKASPFAYELTDVSVNCIWLFLVFVPTQTGCFLHSAPQLQKGAPWVCEYVCLLGVAGQAGEMCGMHMI